MVASICKLELPALFKILSKAAPAITGTDIKKENWPAFLRLMPRAKQKAMVDPDLEIPGTMARPWMIPIKKAILKLKVLF